MIVIFFKTTLAPSGDIFVDLPSQFVQTIDLSRHAKILQSFGSSIRTWGNWGLLVLYGLLLGINIDKKSISAIKAGSIMFLVQLTGYYGIFLITSYSLEWHLLALSRILLQVAPLFLFLYFSIVRSPESIFQPSASGKTVLRE